MIMIETRIRDYSDNDYTAMCELWESLGLGGSHRGDNPVIIRKTIESGGRLLIMEIPETGEIIGTSWMTVDGRRTYLHHFGIKECYQGKKLASRLLEQSIEVAKQIGLQLKLEVHQSNEKAIRLYARYGFEPLGDYSIYLIRSIQSSFL
jgi:ribosomal protein S18 acetylase RimI-like enzyme